MHGIEILPRSGVGVAVVRLEVGRHNKHRRCLINRARRLHVGHGRFRRYWLKLALKWRHVEARLRKHVVLVGLVGDFCRPAWWNHVRVNTTCRKCGVSVDISVEISEICLHTIFTRVFVALLLISVTRTRELLL